MSGAAPSGAAALRATGDDLGKDAVIIQSFETANLRKLDRLTDVRLAQLLDAAGRPYDFTAPGRTGARPYRVDRTL